MYIDGKNQDMGSETRESGATLELELDCQTQVPKRIAFHGELYTSLSNHTGCGGHVVGGNDNASGDTRSPCNRHLPCQSKSRATSRTSALFRAKLMCSWNGCSAAECSSPRWEVRSFAICWKSSSDPEGNPFLAEYSFDRNASNYGLRVPLCGSRVLSYTLCCFLVAATFLLGQQSLNVS